jgi:hypothetical protein
MRLRCADGVIEADDSLCAMSRPRVHLGAFEADATPRPVLLTVVRREHVDGETVAGPLGSCVITLDGQTMTVQVADGAFPGELVLRLAWYIVTTRLGGVLLHASAIGEGDRALVACGKSGDGKSTLARLSHGAGARLLTDEVVQVFPDGRIGGTPFRSDEDNVGSPGVVRAKAFVTLHKADHEALTSVDVLTATSVAMAQCFDIGPTSFTLPRKDVRERLLGFLDAVERHTLHFRKDPAAGAFVRAFLR